MQVKIFSIRLNDDHLQMDQDILNNFLSTVNLKKSSVQLLTNEPVNWSVLLFYENEMEPAFVNQVKGITIPPKVIMKEKSIVIEHHPGKDTKISFPVDTPLSYEEEVRLSALKKWRQQTAEKIQLPGFLITNNAELTTIAKLNPSDINSLNEFKGFGPNKINKYGEQILSILHSIQ